MHFTLYFLSPNNIYRTGAHRLNCILWILEWGRTKCSSAATKPWETLHYITPTSYVTYRITAVQFFIM